MTIEEFLKAHFENKIKNHECLVLYDPDKKMEGTGALLYYFFRGLFTRQKNSPFSQAGRAGTKKIIFNHRDTEDTKFFL